VDVLLEHPRFERPFLEEIEALLDVQECYAISGDFGYRLKIRARDVEHLEAILREKVQTLRGVVRTRVELSLSIKKDSTLLPLMEGA
jgi:DNA-binding Lrp family transcriptional regulator